MWLFLHPEFHAFRISDLLPAGNYRPLGSSFAISNCAHPREIKDKTVIFLNVQAPWYQESLLGLCLADFPFFHCTIGSQRAVGWRWTEDQDQSHVTPDMFAWKDAWRCSMCEMESQNDIQSISIIWIYWIYIYTYNNIYIICVYIYIFIMIDIIWIISTSWPKFSKDGQGPRAFEKP